MSCCPCKGAIFSSFTRLNMQSHFLNYRSSRFHYLFTGRGERLLLCFHGYGESGDSYTFLVEQLGDKFTLVAIDLPYHGKTEWKEASDFTPGILRDIIRQIALEHQWKDEDICLIGFSMGGRIALQLVELLAERISRLVLIAPDGMRVNPWYWFATQTQAGNTLFRFTMNRPGWFLTVVRAGRILGLTNRSFYKFVCQSLGDKEARSELYLRWTCMRRFRPDLNKVKRLILAHSIRVRFLYGKYDRVILPARGERFCTGIQQSATVLIIPAGHQILQERYLEDIVNLVKD